jgi:hypothetical protein
MKRWRSRPGVAAATVAPVVTAVVAAVRFAVDVVAVVGLVAVVGAVAAGCDAGSRAAVVTSSPAGSPGAIVSWAGTYSADDGRSVDPEAGYGGSLTFRLPVSTLEITVRGSRYRAVIATPSLPALAPNTLVFRAVSGDRRDLLAKPAPLTRIALHALTADSFSYVCRVRSNGRWTLFSTMTFQRVKSAT